MAHHGMFLACSAITACLLLANLEPSSAFSPSVGLFRRTSTNDCSPLSRAMRAGGLVSSRSQRVSSLQLYAQVKPAEAEQTKQINLDWEGLQKQFMIFIKMAAPYVRFPVHPICIDCHTVLIHLHTSVHMERCESFAIFVFGNSISAFL